VHRLDPTLILLAPAASQMALAGVAIGLPVVEEIFADRAYLDDGNLVPRSRPDAMIHGAEASLAHVMRMVEERALVSISGKRIPVNPQSICVHGDNADAVATAQTLRDGLLKAGFSLVGIPDL
jgi:5-oxoprolinase (ATP-hydrolysing) subunit A